MGFQEAPAPEDRGGAQKERGEKGRGSAHPAKCVSSLANIPPKRYLCFSYFLIRL
jgi:hypothetical protein